MLQQIGNAPMPGILIALQFVTEMFGSFEELEGVQGLTPVNTAENPIVTFPGGYGPDYQYPDHILLSAGAICRWVKLYHQTVSDHIMLMAEVTVENPEA